MRFKENKGITLIALVITIIILVILAGISIRIALGNTGIVNKAQTASEVTIKEAAKEAMNLKITNVQIESYVEKQRMPTLQEIADNFCQDEDFEYVELETKKTASLNKIEVGENESIFTKLKEYPYEFEINNQLQLASIDGIKIAKENKEYDSNIYDKWDTWLSLAGIDNPEQYNNTNIVENEILMNKLLNNEKSIEYMLKSKYFIMPAIFNSEKAIESIAKNENVRKRVLLDSLWKEKIINSGFINKFDEVAVKIPKSSTIVPNMICSSTHSTCSILNAFDGYKPTSGWVDSDFWIPQTDDEDSYIGYDFKEKVNLYKLSINACSEDNQNTFSFVVQGLNEDGTWENIENENIIILKARVYETYDYYINCDKSYYGYRIKNNYSVNNNGKEYWHKYADYAFGISELQFYCVK